MTLTLYVDLMSQPSRAVLIFCRVNGIAHAVHLLKLASREHRRPEFQAVNPLGQVPAIDDGGFRLQESHAILRYLAATRSCMDHWYTSDVTRRAKVDAVLDWHHNNLRRGSAGLIMAKVLAPSLGLPLDEKAAREAKIQLEKSLATIESIWLRGSASYLNGASQPSIADLSLACELKQLELLGPLARDAILNPFPKTRGWLQKVEEVTAPHFDEVHRVLHKAATRMQQQRRECAEEENFANAGDGHGGVPLEDAQRDRAPNKARL